MASSSETCSASSMILNSGSEGDSQVLTGERKRRMTSNRETAKASQKKHLEELIAKVTQLRNENKLIFTSVKLTTQKYMEVETENLVLRDQLSELTLLISGKKKYEVFLSFRGEDTTTSFILHLYASLENAGIIIFKDDESLPRGYHVSDSQLRAIRLSQISVVVFSRNYAESQWCLQRLEKIMECHRTTGQVVVPVFYGVDPSEVRHQTGEFGKAFHNLLNRILTEEDEEMLLERGKVQRWREVLCEAADISGIVVLDSRNESEAIKSIVENVTQLIDKTKLFVAGNSVEVESPVQDMI